MRIRAFISALVCVASMLPSVAQAEAPAPDDVARAETLFQEAKRLLDAGNTASACRAFEESCRLDPLPGARLNLAVCHEREGKTATAFAEFQEALVLARADKRADREALALERIAALAPKLATVTVRVPTPRPLGTVLLFGGLAVAEGLWGTAVPVDPGELTIRAEASEQEPIERTLRVEPGTKAELDLPPFGAVPRKARTDLFIVIDEPAPPPVTEPAPRVPLGWTITGYSAIGVGGAATIAGVIAGAFALAEESAADETCGQTTCPDAESLARSQSANQAAIAANVLLPIGLTIAAGGVTVVLVTTF